MKRYHSLIAGIYHADNKAGLAVLEQPEDMTSAFAKSSAENHLCGFIHHSTGLSLGMDILFT